MTNPYSSDWLHTFLFTVPEAQTRTEADFLARSLPLPRFRDVLDLCCGAGRHAHALAARGYRVTGLDRSPEALAAARREGPPGIVWIQGDMRETDGLEGTFDGVVCMWQSFGFPDERENRRVLGGLRKRLRPGGRVVLDLYHRGFFEARPEPRTLERAGRRIEERRTLRDGCLRVELRYVDSGGVDVFEWRVYTPGELAAVASECGFGVALACARFDEDVPASPDDARMQIVLERTGEHGGE